MRERQGDWVAAVALARTMVTREPRLMMNLWPEELTRTLVQARLARGDLILGASDLTGLQLIAHIVEAGQPQTGDGVLLLVDPATTGMLAIAILPRSWFTPAGLARTLTGVSRIAAELDAAGKLAPLFADPARPVVLLLDELGSGSAAALAARTRFLAWTDAAAVEVDA